VEPHKPRNIHLYFETNIKAPEEWHPLHFNSQLTTNIIVAILGNRQS